MDFKKKIILDLTKYVPSTGIVEMLAFIQGIIIAKLLGPANYGLWIMLALVLSYSANSHLGTLSALHRNIPFYRGEGNLHKVDTIKKTALGATMFFAIAISFLVLLFSFFARHRYPPLAIAGLRFISVLIICQTLYTYFDIIFRSHNEFGLASKLIIIYAIGKFTVTVVLVMWIGFLGIFWGLFAAYMASFIYISILKKFDLRVRFDFKETMSLMKIGLPMLLAGIVYSLFTTVDRIIAAKFLGTTELGYYGVGLMVTMVLVFIPLTVSIIMYPKFNEIYGKTKSVTTLKNYVAKSTILLGCVMSVMTGVIYLSLPLGVRIFLPNYLPGLDAARVLTMGAFFLSLFSTSATLLLTINKQNQYLLILFMSFLLKLSMNYFSVAAGWGIRGIAATTATSYFIFTSIMLAYAMFQCTKNMLNIIIVFAKSYFPFLYLAALLFCLGLFGGGVVRTLGSEIGLWAFKTIALVLFLSPLLWYANRQTKIMSIVLDIFKRPVVI